MWINYIHRVKNGWIVKDQNYVEQFMLTEELRRALWDMEKEIEEQKKMAEKQKKIDECKERIEREYKE